MPKKKKKNFKSVEIDVTENGFLVTVQSGACGGDKYSFESWESLGAWLQKKLKDNTKRDPRKMKKAAESPGEE